MNRTFAVLLLVLPAVGCDLVGRQCTLMYVPDGLTVSVEAADWEPGAWIASVDDLACSVTLPGGEVVCDDGLSLLLTDDGAGIAAIEAFDFAPDSAEVVLERDGAEVLREIVTPLYDESEPNGKGCGTSRHGAVAVTLPSA